MTFIASTIYPWIDAFWIVIILLAVKPKQWPIGIAFVASCMMMMRLQVELMGSIGFANGVLPLWDMPLFDRGLIVYGIFTILYATIVHYISGSSRLIFMANAISVFFAAFIVSTIAMVL